MAVLSLRDRNGPSRLRAESSGCTACADVARFVSKPPPALTAIEIEGPAILLALLALGHVLTAGWAWRRLLAEGHLRDEPHDAVDVLETLSLAGASAALLLMSQFERLAIPVLLSLTELATFSALASIVIAPLRVLQLGVGRTLFPRLRNAPDVAARRHILARESAVICATLAVIGVCVFHFAPSPFVKETILKGKYVFPVALVAAALVAGIVRVLSSFTNSAVSALCDKRQLVVWNVLCWIFVGVSCAGAVVGARWGLVGVIYGICLGWLARILVGAWIVAPRFTGRHDAPACAQKG